ncbi:MAG: hypothetical protein OEU40_15810, partial [Gammaproteobacteria bacterium]|nr:hypothetical protein [Gammaproteobacteria bacterium]
MTLLRVAMLAAALCLASCTSEQPSVAGQADVVDTPAALNTVFNEYFERALELNPLRATAIGDYRYNDRLANSIGPEYRAADRQLDEESLARLLEIDRELLSR